MYKVLKVAGYVVTVVAVLLMLGIGGSMDMESQSEIIEPHSMTYYVGMTVLSFMFLFAGTNMVKVGKNGEEENARHII